MGCSQGRTTEPSVVGKSAISAEPSPTLLSQARAQKQQHKTEEGDHPSVNNVEGTDAEVPEDLLEFVGEHDWPQRWRALRVFAMADKGADGLLDPQELLGDGSDLIFSQMLQGVLDGDVARLFSRTEWLACVKKFVLKNEAKAILFLKLCENKLNAQKEQWPLRDEALQVFRMGDRNGDGQLDMNELTEIRQSAEFAQAMMDNIDIDKSGTVSKGEWLAYIKRLADNDEKSAAAVLAMYINYLSNSNNTAEEYVAAKTTMDVLVEDSSVSASQRWWACC